MSSQSFREEIISYIFSLSLLKIALRNNLRVWVVRDLAHRLPIDCVTPYVLHKFRNMTHR
jgi:hypothetical protein